MAFKFSFTKTQFLKQFYRVQRAFERYDQTDPWDPFPIEFNALLAMIDEIGTKALKDVYRKQGRPKGAPDGPTVKRKRYKLRRTKKKPAKPKLGVSL